MITFVETTEAKKANAVWYFLSKTSTSINEDENLIIQYGIYTKFANTDYDLGPYPTMRIKVTNKSNQIIYIDLGTSYTKKNNIASAIYTPTITTTAIEQSTGASINAGAITNTFGTDGTIGSALSGINIASSKSSYQSTTTYAQRYVSIPPKSTILLDDIPILTPGSEKALGNLFYFTEVGVGNQRRLWCLHHKFNDIISGKTNEYTESNSLFNIGYYFNYSFSEDFNKRY